MHRKIMFFILFLTVSLSFAFGQEQGVEKLKVSDKDSKWWNEVFTIKNPPDWAKGIGYEIFVRSFYDSNGDGIGDFNGITEKLDYLKSLGVTHIWLMPIHPSKNYHGYDVLDYYAVNPQYGTMEDFENLVKEAHKRGIKVLIDFVYNHTSKDHPWFIDSATNENSKYKDWYVWTNVDPGDWPNPTGQSKQRVWNKFNFIKGAYREGWYFYSAFNFTIPDLNLENPEVIKELKNIAKFWIDKGVDGFRIDAARFVTAKGPDAQADTPETIAFWKDFMGYLKKVKPDIYVVAEIFAGPDIVQKYYQGGTTFTHGFNFEFSTSFVIPLLVASKAKVPSAKMLSWYNSKAFPITFLVPFLSNHDVGRFGTKIRSEDSHKIALTLLLTTPGGLPFLYYGDEIGLPEDSKVIIGDGEMRSIMMWTDEPFGGFTKGTRIWHARFDTNLVKISVKVQENNPNSILNYYRKLVEVRSSSKALSQVADFKVLETSDPILAYARKYEDEYAIIICNLSKRDPKDVVLDLREVLKDVKYNKGISSSIDTDVNTIGQKLASTGQAEITLKPKEIITLTFKSNKPVKTEPSKK